MATYFKNNSHKLIYVWALSYACILLIFKCNNQTSDALGYASSMNLGTNLVNPHHLLYNGLGWVLHRITGLDSLLIMPMLNTILAALLFILYYKLIQLKTSPQMALALAILAVSTFGTLRYAVLNETYLIPLFLSIWGTYSIAIKRWYFGFFLLATAVLFHQIHIFWFVALATVYVKTNKQTWAPIAIGAAIILGAYLYFSGLNNSGLWQYITHDAQAGLVQTKINKDNFIFTFINSIRTWIQVHGDMLLLPKKFKWMGFAVIFLSLAVFNLFKKNKHASSITKIDEITWGARIALFLHFAFAFYSVGNAEFMIMIPYLLVLSFNSFFCKRNAAQLAGLGFAMFIWNFVFYVWPSNKLVNYPAKQTLDYLNKNKIEHFVAYDRTYLRNYFEYLTTLKKQNKISFYDLTRDKIQINHWLKNEAAVYTNLPHFPERTSRATLLSRASIDSNYTYVLLHKIPTWQGPVLIYKMGIK